MGEAIAHQVSEARQSLERFDLSGDDSTWATSWSLWKAMDDEFERMFETPKWENGALVGQSIIVKQKRLLLKVAMYRAVDPKAMHAEAYETRILALADILSNDYKAALEKLDRALLYDPDYHEAYRARGNVRLLLGDPAHLADGCTDLKRARELPVTPGEEEANGLVESSNPIFEKICQGVGN